MFKKILFIFIFCAHCAIPSVSTYLPFFNSSSNIASHTYKIIAIKSVRAESPKSWIKHMPLRSGVFLSKFGKRGARMHTGVDYAAPVGNKIYAVAPGTVIFSGWRGGYGKFIIIEHANGFVSRYAHCSKTLVQKQQVVQAGTVIGHIGKTGNAKGSHLHFEILQNNNFINPARFLGTRNLSINGLRYQNNSCSHFEDEDGIGKDQLSAKPCLRSSSNITDT